VASNKKPGRPPNPEGENKPIGMRPKPHIRAALKKYKEGFDFEVTDSQVLAAALEEFLEKRGLLKEGGK
jgi:hypothetical protein